jgi:hypothetical protein
MLADERRGDGSPDTLAAAARGEQRELEPTLDRCRPAAEAGLT